MMLLYNTYFVVIKIWILDDFASPENLILLAHLIALLSADDVVYECPRRDFVRTLYSCCHDGRSETRVRKTKERERSAARASLSDQLLLSAKRVSSRTATMTWADDSEQPYLIKCSRKFIFVLSTSEIRWFIECFSKASYNINIVSLSTFEFE